jgi:hypothetical protein
MFVCLACIHTFDVCLGGLVGTSCGRGRRLYMLSSSTCMLANSQSPRQRPAGPLAGCFTLAQACYETRAELRYLYSLKVGWWPSGAGCPCCSGDLDGGGGRLASGVPASARMMQGRPDEVAERPAQQAYELMPRYVLHSA